MLSIPRGIVYHKLGLDIKSLIFSFFAKLDDNRNIKAFEDKFADYLKVKFCNAFPFARTAIYYSLKYQKLPRGSEVIMPPISIKGILDVVLDLGLKPVFVDIDPENLCFEEQDLKKKINKNTKSIIITYLYGIVPNMDRLIKICKENNLFIIEDFSHNLNAEFKNKKIGTFGDVGIYSTSSIKTLDTFGGGLAVTDDENINNYLQESAQSLNTPPRSILIKKIVTSLIRNFATNKILFPFITFPLLKIAKKLYPDDILKYSGTRDVNPVESLPIDIFYAYTSFQAKIGLSLLETVSLNDEARIQNVDLIKSKVQNLIVPQGDINGKNVYWQFVFFPSDASKAQDFMHKNNIDTATSSLVNISALKNYKHNDNLPNANRIYPAGLFIPCYPSLKNNQTNNIIKVLNKLVSLNL